MTAYHTVRRAIEELTEQAAERGWDREELLFALLVTAIEQYRAARGTEAAIEVLQVELQSLHSLPDEAPSKPQPQVNLRSV